MIIMLNGEKINIINKNMTILDLLNLYDLDLKITIVEKNEEIVDKIKYDEIEITENDKIEFIRFMGGG